MKSHYVNLSMNDDCVQYSMPYHSSNDDVKTNAIKNDMKHIESIYYQPMIIGMIGNIEIRIDSNNIDL